MTTLEGCRCLCGYCSTHECERCVNRAHAALAIVDDAPKRWTEAHPDGGRIDVDGSVWFACDPYPTWYRWEDNDGVRSLVLRDGRGGWPDAER